jgi:hypothetical protein
MAPEELRDMVRRRPFLPFRVHLNDGRQYDVLYPEATLVSRRTMVIGFPDPAAKPALEFDGVHVSPATIISVEMIPTATVNESRS